MSASADGLRQLAESLPQLAWTCRADGPCDYLNPQWVQYTGIPESEQLGMGWLNQLHPEDRERTIAAWNAAVGAGLVFDIEMRIRRGDGAYRRFSARAIPLRDSAGQVAKWFCAHADIEERKREQEARPRARNELEERVAQRTIELQAERQRLAGIIKAAGLGTWEWNVQTGATVFNDRWAAIIGYTLDEISPLLIETMLQCAHPDDFKASGELLEKHFRGELDCYESELRMKHKDGSWVWVRDRGKVTSWTEDGKPLVMLGTRQDITARKRAEAQKAKLEAELRQSEKMESLGRLAGGLAHDFNNSMLIIAGFSDILMSAMEGGHPQRAGANEIHKAAMQAATLTRQLLAFSSRQVVKLKPINLNEVVHNMRSVLCRVLGENILLSTVLDPNLVMVNADVVQLESIITNLAVNARDAMPKGGRLTISTTNIIITRQDAAVMPKATPGGGVCLAVSDSGIGMDQDTVQHLFEPFYNIKGAGLGLAMVYGIARQHNGWINVHSQAGQGSTFKLYLPMSAGPHAADKAVGQTLVPANKISPQGPGRRILLVEDESGAQKLTTMALRASGYHVMVASTAKEAMELFNSKQGNFDLLFSDVILPDANGMKLAEQFLVKNPGLRILMTSGSLGHQSSWPFLQKPYSIAVLLQSVAGAIRPDPGA